MHARNLELKLPKALFGIAVKAEMLPVHARHLSVPPILYKKNNFHKPSFAEWNIKDYEFFKAFPMKKWSYLVLGNAQKPNIFWDQFKSVLNRCGIGSTDPEPWGGYQTPLPGFGDDDKNDRAIEARMDQARQDGVKILLVVLESRSAAIRARVKYFGELHTGKS